MEDMKFNVEKLKQMSRPMTDKEKKDIEFRKDNREWLAISERLALKLRRILRTEGIPQNELAVRMGVTPAQVTKILSGKENLGLKTISKIENAIGHSLIEVTMEDCNPVVEYENRTVCRSFVASQYAVNTTVNTAVRRRSASYSSIVAHNMFS
jgi:plasmid maintenance system antidote protein, XRE family